jgi:hypothetical protein
MEMAEGAGWTICFALNCVTVGLGRDCFYRESWGGGRMDEYQMEGVDMTTRPLHNCNAGL